MPELSVIELTDPGAINRILHDPWIADRIRHDAREPGYITHPALTYHGAYIDGALSGVFMAIRHSPWEIEVHAALLRAATRHGRVLGQMFLDTLFADSVVLRITAPVLSTLPSAANYCRRLGFVDEGVRKAACRVNGRATDVVYLGLVRGAHAIF